jgi:hypothetical protein
MAQPSDPTPPPPPPPGPTDSLAASGSIREIINEIHQLLLELSKRLEAAEGGKQQQRSRKGKRE